MIRGFLNCKYYFYNFICATNMQKEEYEKSIEIEKLT